MLEKENMIACLISSSKNCIYFPKASCLREEPKCEEKYNEYNPVCPFYKVYREETFRLHDMVKI